VSPTCRILSFTGDVVEAVEVVVMMVVVELKEV